MSHALYKVSFLRKVGRANEKDARAVAMKDFSSLLGNLKNNL